MPHIIRAAHGAASAKSGLDLDLEGHPGQDALALQHLHDGKLAAHGRGSFWIEHAESSQPDAKLRCGRPHVRSGRDLPFVLVLARETLEHLLEDVGWLVE